MIEQARLPVGYGGQEKRIAFAVVKRRAFQERDHLVEHRIVARDLHVMRHDIGEPAAVVGDARADAATGFRKPPMLHVAFCELARRRSQQMFARDFRPRHAQRHHVLELVAETVCAARLIEAGARPDPAGQRLVGQPAVQENVQRAIGRFDLDRVEGLVPLPIDVAERLIEIGFAIFGDEGLRLGLRCGLSQEKDNLRRADGRKPHLRLQRAAGIETRAGPLGQECARRQGERPVERAVATEKLRPVAGPRRLLCRSNPRMPHARRIDRSRDSGRRSRRSRD